MRKGTNFGVSSGIAALSVIGTMMILLISPAVAAQGVGGGAAEYILYDILGVPRDVVSTVPSFIYFLIVPFLGMFAIMYGLLTQIRIFGEMSRLRVLIAFLMVFSTIPLGWFFLLVNFFFQAGTFLGLIAFVVMLFGGLFVITWRSGWRTGRTMVDVYKTYRHTWSNIDTSIKKIEIRLGEIDREMVKHAGDKSKAWAKLEEKLKAEKAKLNEILKEFEQRKHNLKKIKDDLD
jgi:hypothetical protein